MIKYATTIQCEEEFDEREIKSIKQSFENNPYFKCLIYENNNIIYGYLCFQDIIDRIEIDYIFTKKSKRNKKIASQLLEYIIKYSEEKRKKNISLEVSKNNKIAINLYKKYGFIETTIRKNYYGNVDAILMIKEVLK